MVSLLGLLAKFRGLAICVVLDIYLKMATNGESEDISEFTSTAENVDVQDTGLENGDEIRGESWADITPDVDTPVPDVLSHLVKNGMRFKSVPFWGGLND